MATYKYNRYGSPQFNRKSVNGISISSDLGSCPWEEANKIWNEAASLAEATAFVEHKQSYDKFIAKKEQEYSDVNEAPYEGNFSDEYPIPPIPNRASIRRKAGNKALITDFIPRYGIESFGVSYMSQIVAMIAKFKLVLETDEIFSPGEYCEDVLKDCPVGPEESGMRISPNGIMKKYFIDDRMLGIYRFLMLDSRSSFIPQQYKGENRSYCALVPTIMYAFKWQFQIPYEWWMFDEVASVMPYELYKAATYKMPSSLYWNSQDYDLDSLLAVRDAGLLWRSGPKKGTLRNPEYTHTLYGIQESILKDVPELARVMLTQIWCAHPVNRTKYMILTPSQWDWIPPPLISTEVVFDPKPQKEEVASIPWLT